jgi:dTDP-4-dehydrorhamnose reductase
MGADARILLLGAAGQLGFELKRALAPLGPLVAVDRKECDLSDLDGLCALINRHRPAVLVNAAAYTAVDRAESDGDTATLVNETAVRVMAEAASRIGAFVVHYSTDYVFDGEKQGYYTEQDSPAPKNVYGRSKLAGETALLTACPQSVILRTSWVVGAHGGNFAKTILRLAKERESLRIVADQIGAPTSAALIADVSAHIVARMQRDDKSNFPFGLYHLAAGGETNWCEYARFVVDNARKAGQILLADAEHIQPILSQEYPTPAARPKNSRLDTQKIRSTFNIDLPAWQHGLTHILEQLWQNKT